MDLLQGSVYIVKPTQIKAAYFNVVSIIFLQTECTEEQSHVSLSKYLWSGL